MSLISTENFNIVLQSIKKLLSLKADKTEVVHRSEITADEALEIAAELEMIVPLVAIDGTIYTSPNGDIYTLN